MARQRRLPRVLEREAAKLLGTLGFGEYASSFWNLAERPRETTSDCALNPVFAREIVDQATFDPAVVAAGPEALPLLRRTRRNLQTTRGVSSSSLSAGLAARYSIVVLIERLDSPTRERVVRLADAASRSGAGPILLVATENDDRASPEYASPRPYDYVFWPERCPGGVESSARNLALFLHVAGASAVVALGSRLGFETFGRYGCALKACQTLFAALDVPTTGFFADIHHLRRVAPHATILARSPAEAETLRSHAVGLDDARIVVSDDFDAIAGDGFEDRRSVASQTVCSTLLGWNESGKKPAVANRRAAVADFDLTVAILFHAERELAVPALASLARMAEVARRDGISLEIRAFVDRGDAVTRRIVAEHGGRLGEVCEVDLGSPALVRNAAAASARGRFLAVLDGDDLWGADWLSRGCAAAAASPDTVWHPEALFAFYASDCDRTAPEHMLSGFLIQQSGDAPGFDRRDLLFENMWSVNAIAATDIYRRFPFRADDWDGQVGIEDWRWNLETLGHGLAHAVVPDTLHLIRIKEAGSFGQSHQAKALLPFLD